MVENRRFEVDTGPTFGIRHLQCLMIFFGTAVTFAMRVNLAVAIVAMTDNKNANPNYEQFDWDEKIKSYLFGSFFWGYVITQVPGGHLAQRFGAKYLLFYGLLFCSIFNILTPVCTSYGDWKFLFGLRILQGLSQGCIFPSCHVLLAKWSPIEERGVLGTFAYSGSTLGAVAMIAISGVIASQMGWPSIFYLSGLVGLVWCLAWFFLGSSNPALCKMISIEERLLIDNSLGNTVDTSKDSKRSSTPWCKVFTSIPFWSLVLVHSTNNWGYWTLLNQIPSYMKGVFGLDIKKNALLSALPYLAQFVLSLLFILVAKVIEKKQYFSVETNRKFFNSLGHWIPMISLIPLGYVSVSQVNLVVVLLTIAVAFNSAIHLGFQVNHIDLAPNFAGTLMGTTNCFANSMGVFAPLAVGFIVTDENNLLQWRIVFLIAAALYFLGNFVFIIFGATDVQPWNSPETKDEKAKTYKDEAAVSLRLDSEVNG